MSILSVSLVLYACKKGNQKLETARKMEYSSNEISAPTPSGYSNIHEYRTEARKLLSEAMAKAMSDVSFRNFLKMQVVTMLNGETEFLYSQKYKTLVANGKTFAQILADNSTKSLTFFVNDLPYYDPYLSILIPDDYEPENWNVVGMTPKVAAAPSGWDDDTEVTVPLYSSLGQIGIVSSNEQPEEMTIVVTECESLTAFLKPNSGPNDNVFFENEHYRYYLNDGIVSIENGEEMVKQLDNTTGNLNRRSCDRDNNTSKLDRMGSLNINGKAALQQMESWLKGRAEVVYRYVYNAGTPTDKNIIDVGKTIGKIKRRDAKKSISIGVNTTHMIWGSIDQMDRYFILFGEREGNGGAESPRTTELTLEINKVKLTVKQPINWRRRDRQCGEQEVQFCTPANGSGTTFNTGIVTFNIHI
jgi:hypothetical protein